MTLVRLDEVPAQPWRNGGGSTRELLAWPDASRWKARISVAEVAADGPFSVFPGVQRWFAVLEGRGVELAIDGRRARVTRGAAPIGFSGGAATVCRLLGGPTRDLNLMLRDLAGGMEPAGDGVAWRPRRAQCGLYAQVAGSCIADGTDTSVPARALLWFERAPAVLSFRAAHADAEAPFGFWLEADGEGGP
jgi:hypothetical protein